MRVGICGVGAMGGSIGLRARANGWTVVGADSDDGALREALEAGAVEETATREELPHRCEILVLAAHVAPTLGEIARLRNEPKPMPKLIMDIASVKGPVVRVAEGLKNFVSTHPMAGTERSGARAGRADLFEGRPWAYVPSGDAALDERACDFIASMGGVPLPIGADEHDRIVAITSHVPQVVAFCYARLLHGSDTGAERLCGPVARELLRISKMSPEMWRDILQANAGNVARELHALASELEATADNFRREGTLE